MAIPNNRKDLEELGYVYTGEGLCRGCGAPMSWYTTPKGKKMPMSFVDDDGEIEIIEPHWGVCPKAKDFRKKGE